MLPSLAVRPHHPAECQACAPRGAGHRVCQNEDCPGRGENGGAGRIAAAQTRRHATQAEYDAIGQAHRPIDGVAHVPVYGCDDCAEDVFEPFCEHAEPVAAPCPTCGATGLDPCLKKNGKTPRAGWHTGRVVAAPQPCTHVHREDCEIFTGCQCAADDPTPVRTPAARGPGSGPDVSGLTIPVPLAQSLLETAGVPWLLVKSVRSLLTQDNRPAIQAEVYQYDDAGTLMRDEHGHELVETVGPTPLDAVRG